MSSEDNEKPGKRCVRTSRKWARFWYSADLVISENYLAMTTFLASAYLSLPRSSPSLPYLTQSASTSSDSFCDPLSPLDPYMPPRKGHETQGTEFFSAVYLDSPGMRCEAGGTRPLRVRKRGVNTRIAGVGPASEFAPTRAEQILPGRRRRRSTVSVPQSPRSPRSFFTHNLSFPTSPIYRSTRPSRSNTQSSTTSSARAHHSISRIFLAQSPPILSPIPPLPPKPTVYSRRAKRNRSSSVASELHLGLGGFTSYDESARPGPSPPPSLAPSPIKRAFVSPLSLNEEPGARRFKALPASPITPSRAPPKAAALLGTAYNGPAGIPRGPKAKKKDHFRPLPTQTLVEIERFFGETRPNKSSLSGTKSSSHSHPSTGRATSGHDLGDRKIGEGSTIRHKAEDGSMWLDVEEEQEFAWLMSEIFSTVPAPLPPVGVLKGAERVEALFSCDQDDDEDKWGMDSFTSVLHMSRPRITLPSVAITSKAKSGKKGQRSTEDSFMDFGETSSSKAIRRIPQLAISEPIHPWANPAAYPKLVLPPRSTSRNHADNNTRSKTVPHSTTPTSDSDSQREYPPRSESPPRIRNRPPPLTLRPDHRRGILPCVSTTPAPAVSDQTAARVQVTPQTQRSSQVPTNPTKPSTPFSHPRRAPIPGYHPDPLPVPKVPAYPIEEVSYFEPETPIDAKPKHMRVLSGGATAVASTMANAGSVANKGVSGVKSGGAWLKKVVKPLGGNVRI